MQPSILPAVHGILSDLKPHAHVDVFCLLPKVLEETFALLQQCEPMPSIELMPRAYVLLTGKPIVYRQDEDFLADICAIVGKVTVRPEHHDRVLIELKKPALAVGARDQ